MMKEGRELLREQLDKILDGFDEKGLNYMMGFAETYKEMEEKHKEGNEPKKELAVEMERKI